MDCGPTCLQIISKYYGKSIDVDLLRKKSQLNREGVSLLGISQAAMSIGYKTVAAKITYKQLITEVPLPCIAHWGSNHFVVITPKTKTKVEVSDPATGLITYSKDEFLKNWASTFEDGEAHGLVLLLEPQQEFYSLISDTSKKISWGLLYHYLLNYKRLLLKVIITLLIGSLFQLLLPFLTQSIVDTGINTRNINFILIILIGQFILIFGKIVTDLIRSSILLFISTRINVSLLSDFWVKLLKLPLSYFDTKVTGDIWQRLNDQKRIESFLTGSTILLLFSSINIVVFSFVLLRYNFGIFLIFFIGSIVYSFWIFAFFSKRRKLDIKRFAFASKENSATIQLLHGIQDIKLNNAEDFFRWKWESIQASLFNLSFKNLSLNQLQQLGGFFINESKNIFITFLSAKAVLNGEITLGSMLAIQYVIGQLSSPIEQLIIVFQQMQDAKLSLERINEIHRQKDEEDRNSNLITQLPNNKLIQINNLSFTYPGAGNEPVLKNISLKIKSGEQTAIVGMSGSGKTTLLKLLLSFYNTYSGEIKIGNNNLASISKKIWRSQCGTVMQDGYIFSQSIAQNIAVNEDSPDFDRLIYACEVANIFSFVESLPNGFNTTIGAEGNGISQGQKQRILIARAVYKNPDFIFFDEATNALDANNEKVIMEKLQNFFAGKTVIIVAHRLSTVKNADNILVLNDGLLVESGTHAELTELKGQYYQLVKNQLELGN